MTPEKWEEICKKEPAYRNVNIRFIDGKFNLIISLCQFLGKNIDPYRRECLKDVLGEDGLPGVKPCRDCGPKKCKLYVEDPGAT